MLEEQAGLGDRDNGTGDMILHHPAPTTTTTTNLVQTSLIPNLLLGSGFGAWNKPGQHQEKLHLCLWTLGTASSPWLPHLLNFV